MEDKIYLTADDLALIAATLHAKKEKITNQIQKEYEAAGKIADHLWEARDRAIRVHQKIQAFRHKQGLIGVDQFGVR